MASLVRFEKNKRIVESDFSILNFLLYAIFFSLLNFWPEYCSRDPGTNFETPNHFSIIGGFYHESEWQLEVHESLTNFNDYICAKNAKLLKISTWFFLFFQAAKSWSAPENKPTMNYEELSRCLRDDKNIIHKTAVKR